MRKFLTEHSADIYVFPEGFLASDNLEEVLEIIKSYESFAVTGLKDNRDGMLREAALIIDKGEIIGDYTKCILTKSEREKKQEEENIRKPGENYFFRLALLIPPVIWEISVSSDSGSTKQARLMASSPKRLRIWSTAEFSLESFSFRSISNRLYCS